MKQQSMNTKVETLKAARQYTLCALACVGMYTLSITAANAGVGAVLCAMITAEMFTGQLGKAIATVGVLIVGVGAALGRVSWTMAVTVAVGISAMFSARAIAGSLGGGC